MDSPEFVELLALKKEIDVECADIIENFKTQEVKFTEVKQYGKYHPDYQKYKSAFMDAKNALFGNEKVKRYKELERLIINTLDEVSNKLVDAIKKNR